MDAISIHDSRKVELQLQHFTEIAFKSTFSQPISRLTMRKYVIVNLRNLRLVLCVYVFNSFNRNIHFGNLCKTTQTGFFYKALLVSGVFTLREFFLFSG